MTFILLTTIIGLWTASAAAAPAVNPVQAQIPEDEKALSVSPAFTEVALTPDSKEKKVEISFKNTTPKPLTLEMSAIDFKQQEESGMVSFIGQPADTYSYSLASFLTLESNRLNLEPGEKKKFKVIINNRRDLSPGGHYAAVVAKTIHPSQNKASQNAYLATAVSSLLLVRKVGGERFDLSLTESHWPPSSLVFNYPQDLRLTFENQGNIHLVPYGRLEIKDFWGRLVYKGFINAASRRVFPETRRYINATLDRLNLSLPFSINTLTIKGQDSLKKTSFSLQKKFGSCPCKQKL